MKHVLFSQPRNFIVTWSLAEGARLGKVNVTYLEPVLQAVVAQ